MPIPLPAASNQTELLPKARAVLTLCEVGGGGEGGGGMGKQLLTFTDVPHILAVLYIVDHF